MTLLDTSVLIDYFRKSKKENSYFFKLANQTTDFAISTITKYEIEVGSKPQDLPFWNNLYELFQILPFDSEVAAEAVKITKELKRKSQLIEFADIAIAATARAKNAELATPNTKHFERIEKLALVN
jgi:predicted nucleic acid-binding protein